MILGGLLAVIVCVSFMFSLWLIAAKIVKNNFNQ